MWLECEDELLGGSYPRESEISVGVEHWQFDPASQIHITFHFKVEAQVVAFTSGSAAYPGWRDLAKKTGLIRSVCKIPAKFLNTGQYNVTVLIVKNTSRVIYALEDALSFEMIETEGRTGSWYGKEPGAVRPQLPWKIQYIGEDL